MRVFVFILLILIGCKKNKSESYQVSEQFINRRNALVQMPYQLSLEYKKEKSGYILTPIITIQSGKKYETTISTPYFHINYKGQNISKETTLELNLITLKNKKRTNIYSLTPQFIENIPNKSIVYYEIHIKDPYYPSVILFSPITELK